MTVVSSAGSFEKYADSPRVILKEKKHVHRMEVDLQLLPLVIIYTCFHLNSVRLKFWVRCRQFGITVPPSSVCLLGFHTTLLCSRQQTAYSGMQAMLSPAHELCWAWLTSVLSVAHIHPRMAKCTCSILFSLSVAHDHMCLRMAKYWVIQVGLLTPLTFARHRLSPLAAFTSGAYFLHNGRRWQWICEFYTASFKGIFGGP